MVSIKTLARRWFSDYGMALVLLLLGAYFSIVTWAEQHPTGASAARRLAASVRETVGSSASVLIVVRNTAEDRDFAAQLKQDLADSGVTVLDVVSGQPVQARQSIARLVAAGKKIDAIACNQATSSWRVLQQLPTLFPTLGETPVMTPSSYYWPNFLKTENLLNIANQIAVIALIAIGMTMVIVTGGIDLSVGSLIALSAVVSARMIRDFAGGTQASAWGMSVCSLGGIGACVASGLFCGLMVTLFRIPPFIVTLAMMLVASGLAYILANGQSIDQVPDSFIWLGRGADVFHIPNAVLLTLVLYVVAHIIMTRTALGRYIYAVGGNPEAARLSGVPNGRILTLVYSLCGGLAGLGGIVLASQLKSGAPTYGQLYELKAIAAVVVGGTSLAGGEGNILSTLIGALIIAVIENGMNLTGVESYTQKVVLGLVILGAVLLDRLKQRPV